MGKKNSIISTLLLSTLASSMVGAFKTRDELDKAILAKENTPFLVEEKRQTKHKYPIGSDTPKKIKKYYGKKKLTRKQRRQGK